ncbi:MAG: hypothetical protein ACKO40_14360, partial [Planctomycetaceae bacterium]
MNRCASSIRASWMAVMAAVVVAMASGCTSALSTAYLRDTFWDLSEHAAEEEPSSGSSASPGDPTADATDTAAADAERRQAAIDEAVQRLARLGELDAAARDTLIETLQRTQQEDWPVVVEAFASSLAAAAPPAAAPSATSAAADGDGSEAPAPVAVVAASHTVAKADLDDGAAPPAPEAVGSQAEAPVSQPAVSAAVIPPAAPEPAEEPLLPSPVAATLEVRNPCFATRVQAWGVVDRFPAARFRPGQELIVYFELDNLSSGRSAAGHTTCVDTALTLVAGDGTTIRDWSFEPIAETCAAQRRDYFVRYVIRLPDAVPAGGCRLDIAV